MLAVATSCSSSDADPSGRDRPTTTAAVLPTTTVPTDPVVYDATLDRLIAEVDTARGDLCRLRGIAEGAGAAGSPTNEAQAAKAIQFISAVYGAMGDAAPDRADGATIRAAADQMATEMQSPEFDLDRFLEQGPAAFSDDEFRGAVQRVLAASQERCGTPTTTLPQRQPSTTTP